MIALIVMHTLSTHLPIYSIYTSTVSTHLHYLRYTDPDLRSTAVGCGAAAVADQGTASPQHLLYYLVLKMDFRPCK